MAKKQDDLPGVEGPGTGTVKIPELETAVDKYVRERDKRCEMTPKEKAAKLEVIELLIKHKDEIGVDNNGEIVYRYGEEVVTLKPGKPDLKVKTAPEVT